MIVFRAQFADGYALLFAATRELWNDILDIACPNQVLSKHRALAPDQTARGMA
jgi:hypothetical protein